MTLKPNRERTVSFQFGQVPHRGLKVQGRGEGGGRRSAQECPGGVEEKADSELITRVGT